MTRIFFIYYKKLFYVNILKHNCFPTHMAVVSFFHGSQWELKQLTGVDYQLVRHLTTCVMSVQHFSSEWSPTFDNLYGRHQFPIPIFITSYLQNDVVVAVHPLSTTTVRSKYFSRFPYLKKNTYASNPKPIAVRKLTRPPKKYKNNVLIAHPLQLFISGIVYMYTCQILDYIVVIYPQFSFEFLTIISPPIPSVDPTTFRQGRE